MAEKFGNFLINWAEKRKACKNASKPESDEFVVGEPYLKKKPNMCNILVGCTGSVACVKVPELLQLLKKVEVDGMKADVKVVVTNCSTHFLSVEELEKSAPVFTDADEWCLWQKMCDPVLHIELRQWADVMVIAPLGANSMAKIANGMCDNLLTCVIRAWDRNKPLLYCPAMNTHMWEHPVTSMHTSMLADLGYMEVSCVYKKLACGELGFGGMASIQTIVGHVTQALIKSLAKQDSITLHAKVR